MFRQHSFPITLLIYFVFLSCFAMKKRNSIPLLLFDPLHANVEILLDSSFTHRSCLEIKMLPLLLLIIVTMNQKARDHDDHQHQPSYVI
jgi:hypothetical protein